MEEEPKIFINYRRRDDAPGFAMHLYDDLADHFGAQHVFRDMRNIGPGEDFVEVFNKEIDSCRVFLAIIGRNWLLSAAEKSSGKETDHVRLEISSALKRRAQSKTSIMIIPVLMDGASMPREQDLPDDIKELAGLNAHTLIEEYWDAGVQKLIKHLETVLGKPGKDLTPAAGEGKTTGGETEISSKTARWSVPSGPSVIWGTLLGLSTGAAVAFFAPEYEGVISLRFGVALVSGLIAGLISSSSINAGIALFMKLFKGSWYGKILGGAVGGGIGGILAIIAAGLPYFWTAAQGERNPQLSAVGGGVAVAPIQIVLAVALTTCGIALGILAPKSKGEWYKALLSLLIVIGLSGVILFVAIRFNTLSIAAIEKHVNLDSPFALGILAFGLMCGLLSGLQVVAMLMIYDHLHKSENTKPVHIVDSTS
jgi:hypothetical protein